VNPKDFVSKDKNVSKSRKGKRQYLKDSESRSMMKELEEFFSSKVEAPLFKHGKWQKIETLINEGIFLLCKYLRKELA